MCEGRVSNDWNRTSLIACILANSNRDPKKGRPFTIKDFHPMYVASNDDIVNDSKEGFRQLKKLFVKSDPEVTRHERIN